MEAWGRVPEAQYPRQSLVAEACLEGIPVHDVWRVYLPDTGRTCSMIEVRAVVQAMERGRSAGILVPALFAIRRLLGAIFGLDRARHTDRASTASSRVPPEVTERSLVPPGTRDGPFRVLYVLHGEALSEIRNATVEAYLVWSLHPVEGGTHLYWAIHVLPTGIWTTPYLAAIGPFRRFVVYPKLLSRLHHAWKSAPC